MEEGALEKTLILLSTLVTHLWYYPCVIDVNLDHNRTVGSYNFNVTQTLKL